MRETDGNENIDNQVDITKSDENNADIRETDENKITKNQVVSKVSCYIFYLN